MVTPKRLLYGAVILVGLIVAYAGWTEVKVWWKTRELRAVEAATQQFKAELDTAKAQREADLAEVAKRDAQVKALTDQIRAVVAAADRDRQARLKAEQQAAAREPELARLRGVVARLEADRKALVPVSTVHEGVLELKRRGW